MQVNFKGLYVVTGKPENARIGGEAISEMRREKFKSFLEDIENYKQKGHTYYNKNNGDYYLQIRPEVESYFEDTADEYNIDYKKVGWEPELMANAKLKNFKQYQSNMNYYKHTNNKFLPENLPLKNINIEV